MKNPVKSITTKSIMTFCLLMFSTILLAQGLDIDVDINENEWYKDPKYLIGIGVFILLALAILTRSKRAKG